MIRSRRLTATIMVAALTIAGCGDSNSEAGIEPIDSIIVGDINIATDPSGTNATLEVDTSLPVACSVIFGTDDSFGSIAVDNDMQGGAHQDHGPLLAGLTPDTEYQYILQGSDAAGTIYRSEVMTFRTPPSTESGFGPNVAPTGSVTASSEFSDQFAAEQAIDSDPATEWSTSGDGDEAWIELDLGTDQPITAVAFKTRQMTDGTAITETFTVTIDGTTLGPFAVTNTPIALDEPVTGRTLRFEAEQTTGGNTGATEIEVYSTP